MLGSKLQWCVISADVMGSFYLAGTDVRQGEGKRSAAMITAGHADDVGCLSLYICIQSVGRLRTVRTLYWIRAVAVVTIKKEAAC